MPEENSAQPVKYDSKPPAPLNLSGNKVESWKLFKKRWTNYETLSGIGKAPREVQVAMFENSSPGLLFGTHIFPQKILFSGKPQYKFGRRDQQEGEPTDTYISTLRSMLKTCDYCNTCEPSIQTER